MSVYSEDVKVIKRDHTYAAVREIWDRKPDAVSPERLEELQIKLKELSNVDKAVKMVHINTIELKYKKPARQEKSEIQDELACPLCGSKLVLRTAKKGDNAGSQFYGCSAFPKCRYVKNT